MTDMLSKSHIHLKALWITKNREALAYRAKADEESRRAAALQKALDTLEGAMAHLPEESAPKPRQSRSAVDERIAALLKERIAVSAKEIAKQMGIPLSTVFRTLKRGPFKSEKGPDDGRTRVWSVRESSTADHLTYSTSEV